MSIAQRFNEKRRTDDVLISESVDFSGLLLSKPVLQGLTDAGFQRPSPVQLKAIPLGRCGLDLIVQAKSGTGKTCVFTVIALESLEISSVCVQALVLAPTREIAQQIQEVVRTVGSAMNGLKCHTFIGGLPVLQDKILAKNCHIAIGTPGRVKQLIEIGALKTNSVRLFVLDEADKLLEAGFQESINWIYSTLPENKQIVALSATYPEYLAQHLTSYMRNPTFVRLNVTDPALIGIKQYHVVVPNHPLPNIVFNAKTEAVVKILSSVSFQQCLIFSNLQTRAQNLQSELQSRNWPTACIAGCLDQKDRTFAMEQLKTYKCRILISTDLTSRGIDADKVNLVINMDVPQDHETYLHRIGRAGRFGSYGAAITIVSSGGQDKELWAVEKKCKTYIHKLPDPIPKDLVTKPIAVNLDDMVSTQQIINCPEAETSLLTASSVGGRNLQHGHVPDSSPVGTTKKDDSNDSRDLNKSLSVENVAKDSTAENCTSEYNQLSGKDVKTESACDRSHVTLEICDEDTDSKGTQPGTISSLSIEKILEVDANDQETVIEKCSAESGGSGVSCDQTGETVKRQIGVFDDSYHQTCVLQLCLPDEISSKLSIVNNQCVPADYEHLQHKGNLCGDKWKFRSPRKEETASDNSSQECVVSESEEVNIYYDKGSTCSLDSVVVKFEKVKLTESGESEANGTGLGETVPCCEQELKSVSETTLCATSDFAQSSNDIQSDRATSGCENSFCQNSCTGDVSRNTEISSGENVTQKLKSYVDNISKQILQEAIRTRPCLQDIKTRALQLIGSKAATGTDDDKMNDEVDDKMNDEVGVASSNKSSVTSGINLEDTETSLNCGAEENLMSECKSESDQLCIDGNLNLPPACEIRDNSGSMDEFPTENSIIPPFVQEIIDLNSPQKVVNPLEPPLDSVSKPMTDDETGSVTTPKETKIENLEKVSPLSEVTSLVSGELIKPANSGNKMEVTTISEVSCHNPAGDEENNHDGNKTFSVSDQVTMAEENLLFVSASAVEEGKQSIPAETQMSSNSSVLTDNNLSDNLAFEPEKAVVGSPPDAELSQLKAVSNDTLSRNLTDNSVGQESSSVLQENAIGLESEVTAPNVLLDGLSVESDEQNTSSNIATSKAVKLKERTVNETLPSLSQGERKSADVGASASAPALSENKLEKTQTATLSKAGRHSSVELSSPQTDKVPQEQTSAQNSHRVIAKPRQRRGAPRSFAVSDFLHLVNEDLHSFKTMNISNSTENELECKSIDASQAKSPLISAEGVINGAGGDCVKEMPNLEVVSAKEDGEISTKTYSNDNLSCSAAFNNHSCQADLEGGGDYHKYTPVVQNMSGNKHLSTEKSQESDKDTSRSEKVSITSTSASDMDDKQKEPSNEECVPQEDVCKIVDKKVMSISKDDICSSDTRRQDSKPDRVQLTLALNSLLLEDNKVQKHSSMKDLEQDFEEYCQNVDNEVADLINHMNSTALVLSKDLQELCLMEETKLQQVKEDYKEKLKAAESARKAKPEVDESKSRHDSRSDSDGSQRGSGKRKTTPVKEKYRPPGRKELPPQSYEEMLNQYQQDRQVDYKERSKRTKSKFSKHSDSLNWRTGAPQKDFGKDERHQNSPSKSNRNQTAKELNDEKKATNKHVNQKKDIIEKQADVSNGPDGNKQDEKGETVSTKTKQSKQLKQSNEECRQLDDMHSAMLRRRQERKAAKLKAGENGHKENVTEDVASTENSKSEKQGSDIDKNTDNNKPGRSERQHADGTKTNLHQPRAGPVIKGESLNFEKPVEPEDKRVSDNVIAVAVKEETLNMASNKNTIEEKSVLEAGDKMSVSQLTDVIPVMKEERSSIDVSLADEPHKSKVDISTDAVTNQDFSAAIHSQQPVKKKSPVQRKLFDQGDKMQANEPKSVVSKFTEPPSQTTMKPPPEQRMIVSAKAVERQNKPMQPSKSQARHEGIKASEGSTSLEPPNQKAVEPLKTDKVVPTKDVGRNDKPTKPSKSEARLAGIEVSAGSTSSSSELSLSSTSDVSDIASSDVENREVGLKQQCYANKYVQDDDDNIMKNRKSHNKFEADANVVETLKHSQKQVKALKKLQDYELRKKHYQSDAVVAPEMFGLMYPQHPYYATYDGDQCLKDFSASHSLSWHPKKLSSHNTHKESASRRNRDSSRKDPSHSTVGCSTFYVPCNSEENITKKKMGNSTNSKRKERSYPSHAPALEAKESKQQPVLTPEFLSDESSGSESEDEDSSSVPQDYYSHYVQTQIQQQQQQFAFQPPFSYPQQFPYPFYGLPQYPCYTPQNTPSPYPYQANPAFHGMMPAYPPPLPSMSYPQPASHYNHPHYTYLPQQQAPPHYQPSFEMPTKEVSLRSFSLQLKYVKHMTKTLSGLAKKHKISDH